MMHKKQSKTMMVVLKIKIAIISVIGFLLLIICFFSCTKKKQTNEYKMDSYVLSEYLWEDTLKPYSHTCYFRLQHNNFICEAEVLIKNEKIKNSYFSKYLIEDSKMYRIFGDSTNLQKLVYLSYSKKGDCIDFLFPPNFAPSIINKPYTNCYLGTETIINNGENTTLKIFLIEEKITDGQYYKVSFSKNFIPFEMRYTKFSVTQREELVPINILTLVDQEFVNDIFKQLNIDMNNLINSNILSSSTVGSVQ